MRFDHSKIIIFWMTGLFSRLHQWTFLWWKPFQGDCVQLCPIVSNCVHAFFRIGLTKSQFQIFRLSPKKSRKGILEMGRRQRPGGRTVSTLDTKAPGMLSYLSKQETQQDSKLNMADTTVFRKQRFRFADLTRNIC